MNVAATPGTTQGWFPDPHDAQRLRWFNGTEWTELTAQLPAAADAAPFVAWTAEPMVLADETPAMDRLLADAAPRAFSFRARAGVPPRHAYETPLATIASPLLLRPVISELDETPPIFDAVEPDPEPQATHEFEALAPIAPAGADPAAIDATAAAVPAPAVPARWRRPARRTGIAAVVAAAAAAAGLTNLIGGDDARPTADRAAAPAPAAAGAAGLDTECLKLWNTTDSQSAAQLRVTLGQFAGANARVGRVEPLPGTLMEPNSCGLLVYDRGTDTSAVFVAGVKDQIGYLDVTAYPRAATAYSVPKDAADANAQVMADGTLRAR